MLQLDHIAVAGSTLSAAVDYAERALGVPLQPGGQHATFATHNRLLGLKDALYLEAIAADPSVAAPDRPRWFDLDRFEGTPRLTNWICRTDDLEAAVARFPEAGEIVSLSRGDLKWRMAVPKSGILPFDNLFPALIQWDVSETPPARLETSGLRLAKVIIQHPWVQALEAMLAPVLTDDRLVFKQGDLALTAEFDAPDGRRTL